MTSTETLSVRGSESMVEAKSFGVLGLDFVRVNRVTAE